MSDTPLVSVIVPAFNCADYIADSVTSALDQDYPNKEIIVVDDGSTDGTLDALSAFEGRITVIQQQNSGSAVARNTGIKAAKGEFIAFLDSDDIWFPGKLAIQTEYMASHPEIGLVYHRWLVWELDHAGVFPPLSIPEIPADRLAVDSDYSGWIYRQLFNESIIHTTSAMLRRELIERAGMFDTELRKGQDYEYWFRISRHTQVSKLKAVLSAYRINPQSVTNQPSTVNYAALVIKKALLLQEQAGPDTTRVPRSVVRKRLAIIWFDFAYLHYKQGDPWIATRAFARTIFNAPLRVRCWAYMLLSFGRVLRRPAG